MIFWLTFTAILVVLSVFAQVAAYRNGATDGYGYSQEPGNPGYAKAGRYLVKHMAYRWPKLRPVAVNEPHQFFGYLKPADVPVVKGLEAFEVVYAKDQPEYIPLRALRSRTGEGRVMSRWEPTREQRQAIAEGADVFLTLMTFGGQLQPITLAVASEMNPDYVRLDFNLQPHETIHAAFKQ